MADTATIASLTKEVGELKGLQKKNMEGMATLQKNFDGLIDVMKKQPAANMNPANQPYFNIRNGEDPLSSRGFSFIKMLGVMSGALDPKHARVEVDIQNRLKNQLADKPGAGVGYDYKGVGIDGRSRFLVPLCADYLHDEFIDRNFKQEMKGLMIRGVEGANPDSSNWVRNKVLSQGSQGSKALSWLNELTGGSLVAPPEMGELIELLRNKEALVNAGARTVPLPPQGRLKFPRQTAASTAYWVGENAPINDTVIGTGEVTLQAKKLAVMIKTPNELIRFASPAAEALIRDDMTKTLALTLDLAGLEGAGTDTRPRGLINFQNINNVVSSQPGPNGNRLVGEDVYRMIAAVEESNAEFEGWIMRPKTLYKYYQLRADAVAQGDRQGPYLFNLIREASMESVAMLGGYPVTKSTQVSQSRVEGTASNLTYIAGGMWSDLLIDMFGAIEFAATTMGDTAFTNDQTWVRGILSCDIQARHEAAFVWMDQLATTL